MTAKPKQRTRTVTVKRWAVLRNDDTVELGAHGWSRADTHDWWRDLVAYDRARIIRVTVTYEVSA